MINSLWSHIKKLHSDKTGVPERIVEYIAIFEMCRLCATGVSNTTISEMLELEEYYVKESLIDYLDFPGFPANLAFSPYRFYKVARGDFDTFVRNLKGTYNMPFKWIVTVFGLCTKVEFIEEKIKEYD